MAPHTGSPTIFFGTMLLFAAIGAVVPIVWGKETVGQIELVTEPFPNSPEERLGRLGTLPMTHRRDTRDGACRPAGIEAACGAETTANRS